MENVVFSSLERTAFTTEPLQPALPGKRQTWQNAGDRCGAGGETAEKPQLSSSCLPEQRVPAQQSSRRPARSERERQPPRTDTRLTALAFPSSGNAAACPAGAAGSHGRCRRPPDSPSPGRQAAAALIGTRLMSEASPAEGKEASSRSAPRRPARTCGAACSLGPRSTNKRGQAGKCPEKGAKDDPSTANPAV